MLGEAVALITALLWASSTVILAKPLNKIDPVSVNAYKSLFGAIFMLPIAWVMGEFQKIPNIDYSGLLLVTVAALIGFGIGDTSLFKSMTVIGVARSYTIAYTYPFFTMLLAIIFLGEPFQFKHLIGTIIIFIGIANAILSSENSHADGGSAGVALAFSASILWSIGTTLVSLGIRSIGIVLANTLRFPVLFVFLLAISKPWARDHYLVKRNLHLLAISGILGMALGGVAFLESIRLIGASRASAISSTSPVWASLMVGMLLKEKVTLRVLASSIIVVLGVYFLT